jgi:hypothetical protein
MKPPRTISAVVTVHEILKHAGAAMPPRSIKRPRAGLRPDPEPNPSTGEIPMPELTPQSTPPPDLPIPAHDEPPEDDPPAAIPHSASFCLLYVCSAEVEGRGAQTAVPITLFLSDVSVAQRRGGQALDTVICHHPSLPPRRSP